MVLQRCPAMKLRLRLSGVFVACLLWLCVSCSITRVGTLYASTALPSLDGNFVSPETLATPPVEMAIIPGPLRSFLRMAGISQKASPEDVFPLLARNIYLHGYQENRPTEFLLLIDRLSLIHISEPTRLGMI